MAKMNPYDNMSTEEINNQMQLLNSAIYESNALLRMLIYLSNSPDKDIAIKARVAQEALINLKDQAITSKSYANQKLAQDFNENIK